MNYEQFEASIKMFLSLKEIRTPYKFYEFGKNHFQAIGSNLKIEYKKKNGLTNWTVRDSKYKGEGPSVYVADSIRLLKAVSQSALQKIVRLLGIQG